MKEVQGMRLQHLAIMHQAPDFIGSDRHAGTNEHIAGFGRCEVMADRTYAAHAFGEHRHFPEGAALDEFFEAAELDNMESGLFDISGITQREGNFTMAFYAGDRIYFYFTGHRSKRV